jgi:hypothetical protein
MYNEEANIKAGMSEDEWVSERERMREREREEDKD